MSLVTVCDTECNSLDTEKGFIMEIAWGVYDIERKRFLETRSSLLKWRVPYEVDPGAAEVTGLSRELCEKEGNYVHLELAEFMNACSITEFVVGHNIIGYDRPMLANNLQRTWPGVARKQFEKFKMLDTLLDCPFPKSMKQHSLKYLALDHNYVLTGAHQALNDVFACAHILTCYDFNLVKQIASTPIVTMTSKIEFQDLERRDKLKNLRFYWNPTKKVWEKRVREFHLSEVQLKLGFQVDCH